MAKVNEDVAKEIASLVVEISTWNICINLSIDAGQAEQAIRNMLRHNEAVDKLNEILGMDTVTKYKIPR